MLESDFITKIGMTTRAYLETISEKYIQRWQRKISQVMFSDDQYSYLHAISNPINIVVFSADWCPDCQSGVPIVMEIAKMNHNISVHIINRDRHRELLDDFLINGSAKIPLILIMNSKFQELTRWVERSARAYELVALAKKEANQTNPDDFRQIKADLFRQHSHELSKENTKEIFSLIKKANSIIQASMPLLQTSRP